MKDLIKVYYDKDLYLCSDARFQDCFIGNDAMVKRRYEEIKAEYIADFERGDAYKDEDPGTFDEWFDGLYGEGWWDYELAWLSSYKTIHMWYFFPETEELKTTMEMYMLWQNIRDKYNYNDTFGAMMNNPQNDRNGMQFYGFDTETKED